MTTTAPPTTARRVLAAPAPDLATHTATHGPLPDVAKDRLLPELEASGLAGRGGAGFPTWRKLADVGRGRAVVIANGSEGEPLSHKDAVLLRDAPHLVLDGLALAGRALGATELHLYAGPVALDSVRNALAQRPELAVRLTPSPERFVAGEESAVVRAVGGGPALPTDRTTRLTHVGLRGRPTLVQNVETLAHLALLARHGAGWFRAVGPVDDPGTRLVTLSGDVRTPGVLEVISGTPLAAVLDAAGTDPGSARAVLVGGYHGGWVPGPALATAALSASSLRRFAAAPGAGVLHVLGHHRCGLAASAEIVTWLAGQSARQCGPCLNGLPALAETLTRLARGVRDPALPAQVHHLAAVVTGRGSCRHPDGTARLVRSTLDVFSADVAAHLAGRCEVTPLRGRGEATPLRGRGEATPLRSRGEAHA